MRELNLQVKDSKYNQFVQFLTTIDYVKILNKLQQTNAADTPKKVSSKSASDRQKISEMRESLLAEKTEAEKVAEARMAKIKALRGSISKETAEEMLRQVSEMRNEWERQF